MRHKKGFLVAGVLFLLILYADEYHVLLLYDGTEYWFCNFRHHLSIG